VIDRGGANSGAAAVGGGPGLAADGGPSAAGVGAAAAAGGGAGAIGAGGAGDPGAAGGAAPAPRRLAADTLAVRFADAVLARWPNPANIAPAPSWEYNHGIVLRGIEQVHRYTGDARYLQYLQRFADDAIGGSGTIALPAEHNLDEIQPAILLPALFLATGEERYRTAAAGIRARYERMPRNSAGGFWHKQMYPNQMWLDSIYMGEPFLGRYARVFGGCDEFCYDTVTEQTLLLAEHVQEQSGLLYHAWDGSPAQQKAAWADAGSGRSPCVWGRALGWYSMSLVELLIDLPADHPRRSAMLDVWGRLAPAIAQAQDTETGLWFQVVDQGERSDNWIESSASGMFVYALKLSADRDLLPVSYLDVAQRGWQGLRSQISESAGRPSIQNAVQGMGVQTDYAGYVNQRRLTDSPHGLCAILLAASEMEAQ
jgi:unsaturated rhamnogalacturonyl hydrolase